MPDWLRNALDIVELDLRGNRLTQVPDWLGGLTRLGELNLSRNRLTSVPKSLGNLTALTTLDLSGNRLTSVPASLGNLTALTKLNLGRPLYVKWFDGVEPLPRDELSGRMARAGRVEARGKDGNRLTSVPASLGNLTALTTLDLSGNRLTSVPASLGNLAALTTLDLSDNPLTVLPQQLADLQSDGLELKLPDNQQKLTIVASPDTWQGQLLDRGWARLRALFVPSVSLDAILGIVDISDYAAAILQLYSWERDRLLALAKGAAGAAITVLTGLIAAAIEGTPSFSVVPFFLAATLIVLLLIWGGFLLTGLRRLAQEYAAALNFKK